MPVRRRRPSKLKLVVDTNVLVRGIRAFRHRPPAASTPDLQLLSTWIDEPDAFDWLFTKDIIAEYRDVLRRLKVPTSVIGRVLNLVRQSGISVTVRETGSFSPDEADDMFYHCAIDGSGDLIVTYNARDFPPIPNRKRPAIVTPQQALKLILR